MRVCSEFSCSRPEFSSGINLAQRPHGFRDRPMPICGWHRVTKTGERQGIPGFNMAVDLDIEVRSGPRAGS